jgi:hypothetical protein
MKQIIHKTPHQKVRFSDWELKVELKSLGLDFQIGNVARTHVKLRKKTLAMLFSESKYCCSGNKNCKQEK